MTRKELWERLTKHDFYYMMSDDYRVWDRGHTEYTTLTHNLRELKCPFEFWDIYKTIANNILEKYVEVSPGKYREINSKYDCIAPKERKELLTQFEANKIRKWFEMS